MFRMKRNLNAVLIFAGLFAGTATFTQAQQLPQEQETQQINVSDGELQQFAKTLVALQTAEQAAQQKMISIVEEQELNIEKFNEIHQAKMQNAEVKASEAELVKHQKAVEKLEAIQPGIQQQMMEIVTSEGLSLERFQQITAAMQSSPELQQRLQQLMLG
ncbi:hypothetical protein BH23BAC2_BH23BAC2_06030 [soil metagenome]